MLEPRALRSSSTVQRDPEYIKKGLEYVERDLEKLLEPIPAPECRLLPLPLLGCPLRLSCRDLFLSFFTCSTFIFALLTFKNVDDVVNKVS